MSHSKERAEKVCLNCKSELAGRYCHKCGQENVEPKETLWGLVTHFFHDITHFDGKFFDTLKWLVRRPGFLSKEYMMGRRASYLNPVRMYVFTSAIFFLLFFSFFFNVKKMAIDGDPVDAVIPDVAGNNKKKEKVDKIDSVKSSGDTVKSSFRYVHPALKSARTKEDSAKVYEDLDQMMQDAEASRKNDTTRKKKGLKVAYEPSEYRSVEHYDSVQSRLPESERDGWFKRAIKRKNIELNPKFEKDPNAAFRELTNKFMHTVPQLLFVSLPLIALILQLLYISKRREFYFVSHGIFLIHIYIYSFINLILFFTVGKIQTALGWNWIGWIQFLLALHAFWYVYKAMRTFYKQGRAKTFFKYILLNFTTLILIVLLFTIFLVLSIWNLNQ